MKYIKTQKHIKANFLPIISIYATTLIQKGDVLSFFMTVYVTLSNRLCLSEHSYKGHGSLNLHEPLGNTAHGETATIETQLER